MKNKNQSIADAALAICNGDKVKLSNILKPNREPVIVSQRWNTFLELTKVGFSAQEIKQYFTVNISAVNYGLRKLRQDIAKRPQEPISDSLIRELIVDSENMSDALICHLLHEEGYGFNTIARYFNLSHQSIRYQVDKMKRSEVKMKQSEVKMKQSEVIASLKAKVSKFYKF